MLKQSKRALSRQHPPFGLLSYSICPQLPTAAQDWCAQQWLNCPIDDHWFEKISNHKLWPTLDYCLRRNQLWESVPQVIQKKIHHQKHYFAARQLCLATQIEELELAFQDVGLEAVLLKGSALLFYPLIPTLGDRITADIDILINPDQISKAVTVFQELGYRFQEECKVEDHFGQRHLPQLLRPHSLPIEIHPDVSFMFPNIINLGQNIWLTAYAPKEFSAFKIPSTTELFWHMFCHALVAYPQLRNIFDLCHLYQAYDVDLDVLTHRAKNQSLRSQWHQFTTHLDQFSRGDLTFNTIHFWEWEPSIIGVLPLIYKNPKYTPRGAAALSPPRIGRLLWSWLPSSNRGYNLPNRLRLLRPVLAVCWHLYQYFAVSAEWYIDRIGLQIRSKLRH